MPQYKDEKWGEREKVLGDISETKFEEWCERNTLNFVRTGLSRPPLQMWKLPARIRYTPDYLLTKCYVECQGFGRDQKYKLKLEKWNCLWFWNNVHPVSLYVWDSHLKRECFIALTDFANILDSKCSIDQFAEGKSYMAVPADLIFHNGADAP